MRGTIFTSEYTPRETLFTSEYNVQGNKFAWGCTTIFTNTEAAVSPTKRKAST